MCLIENRDLTAHDTRFRQRTGKGIGSLDFPGFEMHLLFLAAAGGAIGAGLRYLVNTALSGPDVVRGAHAFPWSTFTVNVIGGFFMGFLAVLIGERLAGSAEWRTFVLTGVLGGFTTFSAYSLDMLTLFSDGGLSARFIAYTIGSVVMAFAALLVGMAMARTVV